MNGTQLLQARTSRNWEQVETAAKLKVSQPYLSLIESGKRRVTETLARRAVRVFDLPPTDLPLSLDKPKASPITPRTRTKNWLASQLAALGYPKFTHLKKTAGVNPATILISAIKENDVDARIVEALPWLIFNHSNMDWSKVFESAKLDDAQNRLGFLISLARTRAKLIKETSKIQVFDELLTSLEKSKLVRYDCFVRKAMTESEKAWLKKNRSKDARRWRVLSSLSAKYLVF